MSLNLVSTYAPVMIGIHILTNSIEDGKEQPAPVQLINGIGSGMISGLTHSYILQSANVLKAAKASQAPGQPITQALRTYVQKQGPGVITSSFRHLRTNMFAKGAALGVGYFVADQTYIAVKKCSRTTRGLI